MQALLGQFIVVYIGANFLASFYFPASIILVILYIVGLLLPAKEIFN